VHGDPAVRGLVAGEGGQGVRQVVEEVQHEGDRRQAGAGHQAARRWRSLL
jgi:hypothetical protein